MPKHYDDTYEMNNNGKNPNNKLPVAPKSPVKNHGCTDIICSIVFVIFIAILVTISVFAYVNGNPSELVLPHDSEGRTCGLDEGLENKPYLFYFDITRCVSAMTLTSLNGCPTRQICVEECPPATAIGSSSLIGKYCNPSNPAECPKYLIKSKPVFGRCVPEIFADIADTTTGIIEGYDDVNNVTAPITYVDPTSGQVQDLTLDYLNKAIEYIKQLTDLKNTFQLALEDFAKSWVFILIALIVGAVLSFIWMILLRYIIKPIVYITIIAALVVLAGAAAFCFIEYARLLNKEPSDEDFEFSLAQAFDFNYLKGLKETWLVFGIIAGVMFLVLALIMLFLRKRIAFACELIKEASKAIIHVPGTLFWPVVPFLLQLGIAFYCVSTCVYITSAGIQLYKIIDTTDLQNASEPSGASADFFVGAYCTPEQFEKLKQDNPFEYDDFDCTYFGFGFDPELPDSIRSQTLAKYYSKAIEVLNDYQWIPQVYVLFMFFWLFAFIQGLNQMTISGAFGTWYFTQFKNINKAFDNDLPFFTTFGAFFKAIFYHFGTIAFGSLLIAIVKMIRVVLDFISHKLKSGAENSNILKFFLCCLKCCVACAERFLRFLNRYAFIVTSLYSYNFCRAASKALKIIVNNPLRMFILDKISSLLLFFSKLLITALIGLISFLFFSNYLPIDAFTKLSPSLNYYFVPIIVIIIGSYFICKVFFDVFAMGIDTILMCAMIDYDVNDGSVEKPYFMSRSLRKLLHVDNVQTSKF